MYVRSDFLSHTDILFQFVDCFPINVPTPITSVALTSKSLQSSVPIFVFYIICRLSDGTLQWLDLKKKPIRALPQDDISLT